MVVAHLPLPVTPAKRPWWTFATSWWHKSGTARKLTFTREGKWITFLSLAIGLAAINTGNNLLYLLVGWLLSFIVASGVLSEWTMRDMRLERRIPTMVFAGEPVDIEIIAHNDHPSRAAFSLEIQEMAGDMPLDKRCYFLRIGGDDTQTATYRHIFTQRGPYHLSSLRISTRFPFGFFLKSKQLALAAEILVLPARVPVRAMPPRPTRRGDTSASKIGRDGEFYGIREQRLGDDRRSIHWSSTAKMGRYMVREREQDQAHQICLFVEHGVSADEADRMSTHTPDGLAARMGFERGISYAASLAAFYLERGYLVEVIGRGISVTPGTGREHITTVMKALALLSAVDAETPFAPTRLPHATRVFVRPKAAIGGARPDAMVVEV